jgi:hypothetical protein
VAQSGNADHALAVRRRDQAMAGIVPGRGDDDRALGHDLVDRILIRRRAGAFAAEAQVEHARGREIRRHAGHIESRGPAHPGDDVRIEAAAFAENAHG